MKSVSSSNLDANYERESSREMSISMDDSGNFRTFLNNEPDLNDPELALSDAEVVIADWNNSKRSFSGCSDPKIYRREKLKSDTSSCCIFSSRKMEIR